jgi:hypothetical protein
MGRSTPMDHAAGSLRLRWRGLTTERAGCAVVAGPGEFAGKVIGQQDLAGPGRSRWR